MLARNRAAMQIGDFESCERDLRSQPVVTSGQRARARGTYIYPRAAGCVREYVTDVTRGLSKMQTDVGP